MGCSIQTSIYIIFLFAVAEDLYLLLCVPCEDDYKSNCIAKHMLSINYERIIQIVILCRLKW